MKTTLNLLPRLSISDGQVSISIDCLQHWGLQRLRQFSCNPPFHLPTRRMPPLCLHLGSLARSASCGTPGKTGPPGGRRQGESVLHRACSRKILKNVEWERDRENIKSGLINTTGLYSSQAFYPSLINRDPFSSPESRYHPWEP